MNFLQRRRKQFLDWLDESLERRRVRKVSQYAGDLERQIREQLNEHYRARISQAHQDGFNEGVSRTRQTYQNEYDLLRAMVHTKEVKILELEASKGLKSGVKRVRKAPKPRKSRRVPRN
jgi:flagellar biosynthesis/type III secretory pathway protein FliH